MTTTQTATTRHFNAHLEGLGYLSNFEERKGPHGTFTMVTFAVIEGPEDNTESTYYACKIKCKKTLTLLKEHVAAINDRDTKVFAGLKLAKLRAKPFQYGPESQKAGELGINYSANIIKPIYLKVGTQIIDLPKDMSQAKTDYGVPANRASTSSSDQDAGQHNYSQAIDIPLQVHLDKSASNFNETKQRLRDEGYRWNYAACCWQLPTLQFTLDVALSDARLAELKRLGYTSKDGEVWECNFSSRANTQQANPSHYASSNA